MPGGSTRTFAFRPQFEGADSSIGLNLNYAPEFIAVDGSTDRLVVLPGTAAAGDGKVHLVGILGDPTYYVGLTGGHGYNPENPEDGAGYQVVTRDGTTYSFDRGTACLSNVSDANGNAVTFGGSISTSSGASITFATGGPGGAISGSAGVPSAFGSRRWSSTVAPPPPSRSCSAWAAAGGNWSCRRQCPSSTWPG
jgi:hypothetical protein